MSVGHLRTPRACLVRAAVLRDDAQALKAISNQWYAVSYFYAAYHIVRASLMDDPIFTDLTRLRRVNEHYIPDDRWNSHHQARKGTGSAGNPGVRDLVIALYDHVSIEYARLHSASIAVRYELGLDAYDVDILTGDFVTIASAARDGRLVAP